MIEARPSILEAARLEHVTVVKRGQYHVTGCVNHSPDNNPSLILYGERGWCPVCQWHGDALDYVMKLHGLTFKDALSYLGIQRQTPAGRQAAAQARKERQEREQAYRSWEQEQVDYLSSMLRAFRSMKAKARTEDQLISIAEAARVFDEVEHLYEVFCTRDDSARRELYQEEKHSGASHRAA